MWVPSRLGDPRATCDEHCRREEGCCRYAGEQLLNVNRKRPEWVEKVVLPTERSVLDATRFVEMGARREMVTQHGSLLSR